MLAADRGEMGLSATVCRDGTGIGDGEREDGTYVGDWAQEVVDIASRSDISLIAAPDIIVILARDFLFGLLTEPGVLKGVNVSGVSTMPWNELVEFVRSVRPRTK